MTTSAQGRANRAKGIRYEQAVAAWLRSLGVASERTSNGRRQDDGDLATDLGLYVECKSTARLDLAGWLDEARARAVESGRTPVVVVKRKGISDPGRSYAVLELGSLVALVAPQHHNTGT